MIKIQNLEKTYLSKKVLKGINLTFQQGRVYGVVGENGAGKTTLFKCIAGLESHQGEIQYAPESLKKHIGYLLTNPTYMSRLTGKEYLLLMCNARAIAPPNFKEVNLFDLPLGEYASNYSTGMKKKLALLALLIQDNDLLILDEPFNGVDIHSNLLITEIIKQLKNKGKTILIASHIFSSLSSLCDQIYFLKDGVIEDCVSPDLYQQFEAKLIGDPIKEKLNRLNFIL